jgi:transposase
MNGAMYKEILNKNLFESVNNMEIEEEYIFQQDNDSKHTSRVVKDFLLEKEVNILPWPTNSQDLNPIENLWAHSKSKVLPRLPFPRGQLEDIIKEE